MCNEKVAHGGRHSSWQLILKAINVKFRSHFLAVMMSLSCGLVSAEDFRILSWNVESNRPGQSPVSDATTIATELKQMAAAPATRFEILALSEVEPKTMETFKAAVAEGLGNPVDYVSSASGGFADTDSLMLLVE